MKTMPNQDSQDCHVSTGATPAPHDKGPHEHQTVRRRGTR